MGDIEAAKAALNRVLLINPNIGPAVLEVADIAYQEGEHALALEYLEQYERTTVETPRSLMLGVQISRVFGEAEKEQSYSYALQTMFPDSTEARELRLGQ
jgi:Tfp pilus assembly protein PilF